ncbi:MAG TPA: F0F1 ATP synthase subunit epsilon, partial [Clostridiales bacterium]|nr:F0F1 ATP synthase subunit epsilon [Clostridiales bacterium]
IKRASCIGGFISVSKELVLVAATTFEWAEDIDYDRTLKAKAYAENIIETDSNEKKLRIARNKLRRANVRIKVVNNNKE